MLRPLLLAISASLACASPVPAAWFPAEPVDGPSEDILVLSDIDVARDGTGALVYLKREYGGTHVFLSRLVGGTWRPPERVDINIDHEATGASVAAADGNQLVVLWTAGDRVYGASYPRVDATAPLSDPQLLFEGAASDPHVDLGINGTAYGVFTAGDGDVRAVRLFRDAWQGVDSPLDIQAARPAGQGEGRPRVAVAADGNALVVWGEIADGRRHLVSRRLTGLTLSAFPQELSLPELGGAPGGDAGSVDLDTEDDGSYAWAVFRQDFGGTPRAVARRLVGSQWEAPAVVDAGGPAGEPRVAMSGRGVGAAAVSGPSGAVHASLLELDAFGTPWHVGASRTGITPAVAASERDEQAFAWPTGDGAAVGVYRPAKSAFEPPAALSNPAYGGVAEDGGFEASEDRLGDVAVAFVQAAGDGRRVMVAHWDRPPGRPEVATTNRYQRHERPTLKWRPALDLWGGQTFAVYVDGVEVGRTTSRSFRLPEPLADGRHTWRLLALDRRGQSTAMTDSHPLHIDTRRPRLRVQLTGLRVAGAPLHLRAYARDGRGGTGVGRIRTDWGDGTRSRGGNVVHRYRRPRRAVVRVRAYDRAGNVRVRRIPLWIG